MRVLLDASAVPRRPVGAGVYVLHLAAGLASRDEVDLQLLVRRDDRERWEGVAPGSTVHAVVPTARGLRLAWEQWAGARLARDLAVDVWHGPHYTLPARLRVPSVATIHDLTFFDHPEWHERVKVPVFRAAIRRALAKATVLVAVSEHTAAGIARRGRSHGVVVAAHGVDHAHFRAATPEDDASDRALLRACGATEPYVAFAGTMEPRKDVANLVAAFAAIARDRPELRLVLAGGDGWGSDAVRDAVARSGVATRIVRPGYVAEAALPALYRRAAAVAYPSLDEGFGLPVLEALACGAPVVTTEGTAMAEVAGDAAVLVAPGDAAALGRAIAALVDDPDAARAGSDDRVRRAGAFTWSASLDRHLAAYRQATGR